MTQLGGKVIREPWASEFGTFALVNDPTGALFVLGSVELPHADEARDDEARDDEPDADLPIG